MKLITELHEEVRYLEEAKEDGTKDLFIEGVFVQGGIKNRNGRVYPVNILDNAVSKYVAENVDKNRAYGELGHPSGPTINLDRASHMIKSLRKEGNNYIGKAKVMDTPMGNIVRNLIKEGANLGVSSRGMGSLKQNKEGIMEVQDDFFLATAADIVADPSAPDAFVNGIMEGVDYLWDNGKLITKTAEEIQQEINESVRQKRLNEQKKLELFNKFLNSF